MEDKEFNLQVLQSVIKLTKKYPNDQELGEKLRTLIKANYNQNKK